MSSKKVLELAQERFMKRLQNEKKTIKTLFGKVSFRPSTLLQRSAVHSSYEEAGPIGSMVTTLIVRLEDADGNSVFSSADYDILTRKVDPKEIQDIYGEIVDFDNSFEDLEDEDTDTEIDKTKK